MCKIICLVSLQIFLFAPNIQAKDSLKKVEIAVGEFKPFVTQFVEGYGESTELVTSIIERMGYRPIYLFMPWGQAEKKVKSNQKNNGPRATFLFRKSLRRKSDFEFSEKPILESCIKIFYNKEKISKSRPNISNSHPITTSKIEDLKNFKLGYVSTEGGYEYPGKLGTLLKENGVSFGSLFEIFDALVDPEKKNVEAVPAVGEVGQELLYYFFPEERFQIGLMQNKTEKNENSCFLKDSFYFMVSKINPENAEFIEKFNKAYRSLDIETKERINRRAKERPSDQKPEIILNVNDISIPIIGKDFHDKAYLIPRGTRGKLLKWIQLFDDLKDSRKSQKAQAEVILFTGPLRGKKLWVEGKFIELVN
jgi:hypothetical protein